MDRQILNKDKELMKQQRFLYNYKQKKVQFTYYEKLINILIFRMLNAEMFEINKKLAFEKQEREEYMKKICTNIPTEEYYNKFNSSLY